MNKKFRFGPNQPNRNLLCPDGPKLTRHRDHQNIQLQQVRNLPEPSVLEHECCQDLSMHRNYSCEAETYRCVET